MKALLGLPLEDALDALADAGIAPVQVTRAYAPRRSPGMGRERVVRVREGGRALIVCAFLDEIQQEAEHGALET